MTGAANSRSIAVGGGQGGQAPRRRRRADVSGRAAEAARRAALRRARRRADDRARRGQRRSREARRRRAPAERMPVLDGLVHSIAWAPAHDLQGNFVETTRDGFAQANDISSYSLIATAREARRLMTRGGAIVTMTYAGSWRVVPNYNVMGPGQGVARERRALPGGGPRAGGDPRQRGVRQAPSPPWRRARSRTSAACSNSSRATRRCAAT